LFAVARLPDDLYIGLGSKQAVKRFSKEELIVREYNPDNIHFWSHVTI
jgi:hypothetical protein